MRAICVCTSSLVALASGVSPASVVLPPAPAGVQVSHEYGQEYVTIGDAGNRNTRLDELRQNPLTAGAVPYEYRMARTEVTVGQWFEFVTAYDQFNEPPRVFDGFSGQGIEWDFGGQAWYTTLPLDFPTSMNWEYAARYTNWLHNDKAITAEAFESGAYDTSTFTYNPDGSSNYQEAHSPGARFWIPTHDEWIKSVYWDSEKNGGEGGYWYYPGGGDDLLISGPPGVGQTNAGSEGTLTPVASYGNVQTPWGLLDASGGVQERTETAFSMERSRYVRGSYASQNTHFYFDGLDVLTGDSVNGFGSRVGLRLAAAVPAPAPAALGFLMFGFNSRRTKW